MCKTKDPHPPSGHLLPQAGEGKSSDFDLFNNAPTRGEVRASYAVPDGKTLALLFYFLTNANSEATSLLSAAPQTPDKYKPPLPGNFFLPDKNNKATSNPA